MASIARQSPLLRQTCLSAFRSPLATKNVSQAVAFHASAKKQILPPLPQVIHGSTNDPAPIPEPHPSHGSYHWSFERLVAAGLVPLTLAPFIGGTFNPVMDAVLCSFIVVHSHVGFQASIIDYFPARRVPKTASFMNWLLRGFTLTTAVGLYEFETNDVGITEAIKRVWKA
ncbi:membrane anchor subunit of succinate dehydrogenase, Sdh4 [Aspergillus melleus]|uniref:Membrane anchor subunit of succinate dehydrogenase, Sdh4 n=1 Tax=Aspergillus melleus TaxID=138277 RepID=A0ACC3B8N3_9EURO|nr:membrane anchor subunit of succinate dehydrogenase, Sdh4 [Aspergillus melleus]KAH8434201.1 membrane anchor subunit of succinate dehydrogenase, Sdh4 [Aspergillus melleus]KAK1146956.1 membrane anchor subunit of succinate dehydrogenase, Sdh4 [Aspergillus melleus]